MPDRRQIAQLKVRRGPEAVAELTGPRKQPEGRGVSFAGSGNRLPDGSTVNDDVLTGRKRHKDREK